MPVIYTRNLNRDSVLAVWHITENAEELYAKLQLNDAEKRFYEGLNGKKRNMHWLGSRVLLRTLLNTNLYIDCQLDENNKPYLVNFPYQISISHSNDFAAVIICKDRKAGIDIEKMSDKIRRIEKRFLSEDELSFVDEEHRIEQLYVCWGAKESLFKLYGKGNLPFISGIQIQPFKFSGEGSVNCKIVKEDYKKDFQVYYTELEDYMLTWVIED